MLKEKTKKLISHHNLSENEAYEAIKFIMEGKASDIEISSFLTALSSKGETIEEITAAAKVMREKASTINSPIGAIDCCGTGGDGHSTFNISTAVSFICAAAGIAMAKHGNRSASSQAGAADTLEASGININISKEKTEEALKKLNFAFLMAPNHHKAMKNVANVRKNLGFRTIFNILGPLSNPCGTKRQLIGVYDKKWLKPIAYTLKNLGTEKAWIVHGSDGMDEITLTGKTYITELDNGKISDKTLSPEDFNLPYHKLEEIKGSDAKTNSIALIKLLNGEHSAYRNFVTANAAACLIISGKYNNLKEAVNIVSDIIDSGKAFNLFNEYKELTK